MADDYIKRLAKRLEDYTEEDCQTGETQTAKEYKKILKKTNDGALYIIEWLFDLLDCATC